MKFLKGRNFALLVALLLVAAILVSGCTQPAQQGAQGSSGQAAVGDSGAAPGTAAADGAGTGTQTAGQGAQVKEFEITAKRFEFTPNAITVNKGDTVRLIVTSTDVTHGFSIDEYNVHETLSPNNTVTVEFVADKEGTFRYYCSVFCGSGHSTMFGLLTVR